LADDPAYFIWYELMTTDVAAAAAFYGDVIGWGTEEVSAWKVSYTLFTTRETPVAGLAKLPEEARRMGAAPRWTGYVGVKDVHATADRIRHSGGQVYVPPAETDIGLISVIADPNGAIFGLADERLRIRPQLPTESGKIGRIGWNELFAADLEKQVAFYRKLFGWRKVESDLDSEKGYQAFSAGGQVIGGALQKLADQPAPFWLFYFNVEDLDAAAERVRAGGGSVFLNDVELPGDLWFAHCVDPQGAAFALRGKEGGARKLGWTSEWQGFSSRGQLVRPKPWPGPSDDSKS
jgi:predicted enzyme related to lactoylglutathione lyase